MSVSTEDSRTKHNCNGSAVTFTFTFPIIETSDIKVVLTSSAGVDTTLTETTHYAVSATNNDYSSGGTVTTVATYAAGNTITIYRDVPLTQESDFTEGMLTLYETFEDGLDKLTMIAQQNKDGVARALVAPETDATTLDLTLPNSTDRANKYLAFDVDGEPIATAGTEESAVISIFAARLLDDRDADAMRTTLGLGTLATLNISTDGTLADNLDTEVPSEKAVKTYADTKIAKTLTSAQGDIIYASAANTPARLEKGTARQALMQNVGLTAPEWADRLTSGTVVNAATGSPVAIDFTSIPAWVKRITILLNAVSTNGTSNLQVQIGTGGTPTTSGYISSAVRTNSGGVGGGNATAGFLTEVSVGAGAGAVRDGSMVIENISGNIWVSRSIYSSTTGEIMTGAGRVTLAGTLDMVRITAANGTDAFDAGYINILYE